METRYFVPLALRQAHPAKSKLLAMKSLTILLLGICFLGEVIEGAFMG
jgi:hypothetical protein